MCHSPIIACHHQCAICLFLLFIIIVSLTCHLSSSLCHSPVTFHYHCVTHLSLFIINVSLSCHLSLSVCPSPVTRHYQCVAHLSLVIIIVSLTCHLSLSLCHPSVTCHYHCVTHLSLFRVDVRVRRIGGAFGAKQSRSTYTANAAALAAYHLQRPVSVKLTIEDNMEIIGRRQPLRIDYEVSRDEICSKFSL